VEFQQIFHRAQQGAGEAGDGFHLGFVYVFAFVFVALDCAQ
jgi:hypothetical protein